MPTISPRCSDEPRSREAVHFEERVAGMARRARIQVVHRASDHQGDDLGSGHRGGRPAAGDAAVAQHEDRVGDRLHFLDEVRDVDDREPLAPQLADQVEQPPRVLTAEAARRLVEDEHAAAARDSPGDFDDLLRRDRQLPGRRGRIHVAVAEPPQRIRRDGARAGAVDHTEPSRLDAEHDVLRDAQVRRDRQLLVDHRDAGAAGVERLARTVGRAVERHRAGVGPERAGQDAHQRALAGAVLSDERAHFAAGHGDVHPVERHRRAERLADAAHLEARRPARYFSHFLRSGCISSFISGVSIVSRVTMRTPVSMRRSTFAPLM